jgi:hypothetical protein
MTLFRQPTIKLAFGIFLAACVLFIISCGQSNTQLAKKHFELAKKYYGDKQFNQAKLELDTILTNHKDEIELHTRAKDLMRTINIDEQNQNLLFLDSLLSEKQAQLAPLMKNFATEQIDGLPTLLVHKFQKTTNSYNRTFIKPNLDVDGNYFISSQYCGNPAIEHTQIKVSVGDDAVNTEDIAFDDFYNHRFSDAAFHWEIVQYKDGKDNGVVDFIAKNYNKPIKVLFVGKRSYAIIMETYDKEAIRDSYEISFILKEIARIKKEKENAKSAIEKLR